jgi:hypothetical protein
LKIERRLLMKKNMKRLLILTLVSVLVIFPIGTTGLFAAVDSVGTIPDPGHPPGRSPQLPFAGSATPVIVVPPGTVVPELNTSNTEIKVFNEKQHYVLPVALQVDQTTNALNSSAVIPAGTVVNSHFIHFDNVGTTVGRRGLGYIKFDGDIIGLITQDSNLYASDPVLGLPGTNYPIGLQYRGLEQGTGGVGDYPARNWTLQDIIWINGDTLEVDLQVFNVLDQLRVVTEPPLIHVTVDIKPQSCPNPLNVNSKGVLPVAILGTATFDVTLVDPSTVRLEGVSPLRWDLEDVATPFEGDLVDCNSCTTAGPDGFIDLTLKFDKQEVIAAIGEVEDGTCLVLTLTGELYDDTAITGEDIVRILKKGKNNE